MKPFRWRDLRVLPKPDHLNKEGFPSYSRTPEEDIINILMTGTTANTFYVNTEKFVEDVVDFLKKYENVEFLAKTIVYAREEGYKREMPILGEVALSTKDINLFKKTIQRVCKNPHDWQKFIDICRSGVLRKGLGRALKEQIIEAIRNMPVYHAIKYPKAVRDMIRIARPHENVNQTVIKYIMKNRHEGDEQLEALYKLKHATNEDEIVRLINEGKLPYEVVTGSVLWMTPEIWEALLYQAPYFNLLRNLNNFIRNGVLGKRENLEYVVKKLTNKEAILNSKLFPFRFYTAYMMLKNFKHIGTLRSALEDAIEISVANVPEIKGKVVIAPDVSGSMSSYMTGDYSTVLCCDIVGVFTGILMKKCEKKPIILPFDTEVRYDIAEEAYEKETILEIAECFGAHGGTSLSAPVRHLIDNKEEVDYFIAITDNEEWVEKPFIEALREYIDRINPDIKVYLITLLPYRDYPVPAKFPNVYFIYGWSDVVLKYIATDTEEQIKEIEKIEL